MVLDCYCWLLLALNVMVLDGSLRFLVVLVVLDSSLRFLVVLVVHDGSW